MFKGNSNQSQIEREQSARYDEVSCNIRRDNRETGQEKQNKSESLWNRDETKLGKWM